MKTQITLLLLAVSCMALEPQLVVLRTFVTTNAYPAWVGGPEMGPTTDTNGIIQHHFGDMAVPAIAVFHPARTVIVTNYVIGYYLQGGTNPNPVVVMTVP